MTINPVGHTANPVAPVVNTPNEQTTTRSPPAKEGAAVAITVAVTVATTSQTQAAQAKPQAAPTLAQIEKATKQVQEMVQSKNNNLEFSLDKDSGKTVVKVIDSQTKEVIKQFPSEEILALAHALEQMQDGHGMLLKGKA